MKRFLIIVVILAVVGGGTWALYTRTSADPADASLEGYSTEPATISSIDAEVTVTGNLVAQRTQNLTLPSSGTVTTVYVQEDDRVERDQILAELDTTDLELSVAQAEAALAGQEANLARARKGASEQEIASAEAAIASAEAQLEDLQAGPSARDIEAARIQVEQAKASLWGAQGSRDATVGSPMASGASKAQAEAAVSQAEWALKQAELQYERLWEGPNESAIANAEAQLASAQANLARLLNTPSEEDIAVAEAQVEQARLSLESARSRLDDAIVRAPASGVLATWTLREGDTATPGTPVGTLVDDTAYHVEVAIDETEIGHLQVGQNATITLDAFPEQELTGRVESISLLGSSTQGLVNYTVEISLEDTDLAIRPMMTAVISIVTDTREDVLVVPNRALRRDRDGTFVEVLRNGTPARANVVTGISNDVYTEIIEGLEEGDPVVVARPRESVFETFGG
jgi:HlyD family secretion protein